MGLTGKYDFSGIRKLGAAGLRLALSTSPWSAWLLKGGAFTTFFLELLANWLANKGLVMLNLGYVFVDGELDQKSFDKAMSEAFSEIEKQGGNEKLTPEQVKAIDDEVIKSARKFIVIGKPR